MRPQDFIRQFTTTFRIKKGTLNTDPTVNGSYDKLRTIQQEYNGLLLSLGYPDPEDILVFINYFLILDTSSPSSAQLLASFSDYGTSGNSLPEVALSSQVLQIPEFQLFLVHPSIYETERSRTAQNAGMSVEYILQRYASGQALPVMNRNSMSDSQRGLSEEDMKNIRVIENEMDAQQYVRDVRAAEVAQAEMEHPTETPSQGDADPAKDQ